MGFGSSSCSSFLCFTFAQNLPLARLETPVYGQRVSQLVKQLLHLLAPLALRQLVRHTQLGRPRVRRVALIVSWSSSQVVVPVPVSRVQVARVVRSWRGDRPLLL